MTIDKNKVVSLIYELHADSAEGDLIEKVEEAKPFSFITGVGFLLEKFEENLHGLKEGEAFEFTLTQEDAYGEINDEAIVEIPKDVFKGEDGKIDEEIVKVGNFVPMSDEQGNPLEGLVLEMKEEVVIMDFNHPLAGMALYFKGKITGIREATTEEIEHGHVHDGTQH